MTIEKQTKEPAVMVDPARIHLVDEQKRLLSARADGIIKDTAHRSLLVKLVGGTLVLTSLVVTLFMLYIITVDMSMIREKLITPEQRYVPTEVLLMLLGSSVVQIGAIAVIFSKDLFGISNHSKKNDTSRVGL